MKQAVALFVSDEYEVLTSHLKQYLAPQYELSIYKHPFKVDEGSETYVGAIALGEQAVQVATSHPYLTKKALVTYARTPAAKSPSSLAIEELSDDEYVQQLLRIFTFLPTFKHILIFEEERGSLRSCALTKTLKAQGYIVSTLALHGKLTRRDILHIASHDLCIVMCNNVHADEAQRISILCQQHGTCLYYTKKEAIHFGASLTFDLDRKVLAKKIVHSLTALLENRSDLQKKEKAPYRLTIDREALKRQGTLPKMIDDLTLLVQDTVLITPDTREKVNAYLRMQKIPLE